MIFGDNDDYADSAKNGNPNKRRRVVHSIKPPIVIVEIHENSYAVGVWLAIYTNVLKLTWGTYQSRDEMFEQMRKLQINKHH